MVDEMAHHDIARASHALLLVGHGSRDADGQREFLAFAARVQQAAGDRPVLPCFLELAQPTIGQGITRCLELGYRDCFRLFVEPVVGAVPEAGPAAPPAEKPQTVEL